MQNAWAERKQAEKPEEKIPLTNFYLMARKASSHSHCCQLCFIYRKTDFTASTAIGSFSSLQNSSLFNVWKSRRQVNTALASRAKGFKRQRYFKCSCWLRGRIHPCAPSVTWEWQNCPVHSSKTSSLRSHTMCNKSDSSGRSAQCWEEKVGVHCNS